MSISDGDALARFVQLVPREHASRGEVLKHLIRLLWRDAAEKQVHDVALQVVNNVGAWELLDCAEKLADAGVLKILGARRLRLEPCGPQPSESSVVSF